jgi:hypothetical protein
MKYEIIIENFINGNLKDFRAQVKKLRNQSNFWLFVSENYGDAVMKDAMNFLRKF